MNYEIMGEPLPVVVCTLEKNETLVCQNGAMVWMSQNMSMSTTSRNKGFSHVFTGEAFFQNTYTAKDHEGLVALASSVPGSIIALMIAPGHEIIAQKGAYLGSEPGVKISVHLQHRFSNILFGGEGLIMQKLSGHGLCFLEIDGSAVSYDLDYDEAIVVDPGSLALMDASCRMEVQGVKGVKNKLFGGEGFFHTVIYGPGKVVLQTMPLARFSAALRRFFPNQS